MNRRIPEEVLKMMVREANFEQGATVSLRDCWDAANEESPHEVEEWPEDMEDMEYTLHVKNSVGGGLLDEGVKIREETDGVVKEFKVTHLEEVKTEYFFILVE